MKKVLILTNSIKGLYNFRRELIQSLIHKYTVEISAPNDEKTSYFTDIGCKCFDTPINRRSVNPFADIELLLNYKKIIKRSKPDVVLTYTIKPNIYGGLACRILNIPYVANITGLGSAVVNKGVLQTIVLSLYRFSLKNASCVFFQNESNQKFLQDKKVIKGKVRLIPGSGVNLKYHRFEKYPKNDNNITFLFIGRIMQAKGVEELFRAAKVIKEKHPRVQFNIVGISEEKYDLKIEELERQNIVKYYGHQEDVHSFIKDSHATILPSHHEGLSNVLLETASSGRPIIASNVPGCKETFDDGHTGIGFEVKNVDSLINAITKFIQLPYEKKREMGQMGREKIEKVFDRNIVIEAYLEEISKVVNGKK